MTLVNLARDAALNCSATVGRESRVNEAIAEYPFDIVVLDVHLRRVEAFAVLREIAGDETQRSYPPRSLAASPIDDLVRERAFTDYLEWRIAELTRAGDALGML